MGKARYQLTEKGILLIIKKKAFWTMTVHDDHELKTLSAQL